MKIKHPEFWHRIKEKEQNLTGVNTFKTPEEVFQKHRMSIMNSSTMRNMMNASNSNLGMNSLSNSNLKRVKLNSYSKSKNDNTFSENQKKAYKDNSVDMMNSQK
jgi:hypothetical protein